MSIKVKQAIVSCLEKIARKEFDEDTIRTLLISCREKISTDGIVRELPHFIAHTLRKQGVFHRKVNSRYTKFKLAHDQTLKLSLEEITKRIKQKTN